MTDPTPNPYELPSTLLGTTYLTENVTAMFPNDAMARAAGAAVEAMGIARDQMIVGSGERLLQNERLLHERRSLRDRLAGLVPSTEDEIVKRYTELASQGYAVVAVHVPEADEEQRRQVAATLRQHGGIDLHYYGKRTITDL